MNDMVSVIVTSYNYERYLKKCLDSVVNQFYKPVELIVFDDGSTDASVDIIKSYKDVILVETKGAGAVRNRNEGIKMAKGKYVCVLDSDDFLCQDFWSRTVPEFTQYEKVGIVSVACVTFGDDTPPSYWRQPWDKYGQIFEFNKIMVSSPFLKSAWEEVGGYDESLITFEDWDLWMKICIAGYQVAIIGDPLFYHRIHPSQASESETTDREAAYKQLLEKYRPYVEKYSTEGPMKWTAECRLPVMGKVSPHGVPTK